MNKSYITTEEVYIDAPIITVSLLESDFMLLEVEYELSDNWIEKCKSDFEKFVDKELQKGEIRVGVEKHKYNKITRCFNFVNKFTIQEMIRTIKTLFDAVGKGK